MEQIVLAAGGNATAIVIVDASHDRSWYEEQGRDLMKRTEHLGVEQAGFLNLQTRHFEMSGGEFCGNAARSAAMLIARTSGESEFDFTMSGYDGSVHAIVWLDGDKAEVTCAFPNMKVPVRSVKLPGGDEGMLVDLGGIVHVLTRDVFVDERAVYELKHREITQMLGLSQRDAVGVCWIEHVENGGVLMHPVVWVRGIDSFFYETACGSGSIAVAAAMHVQEVIQPSGQTIRVVIDDGTQLSSTMEISHAG